MSAYVFKQRLEYVGIPVVDGGQIDNFSKDRNLPRVQYLESKILQARLDSM